MKKAKETLKIISIVVIVMIIFTGIFVAPFLYAKFKGDLKDSENKEFNTTVSSGTTYFYSEEDVAKFKSEAEKIMNAEVKRFNLEPGVPKIIKLQREAGEEGEREALERGFITQKIIDEDRENTKYNYHYSASDLSDPKYRVYKNSELSAVDVFNDDLSLKDDYVFYGYTSVANPSLERLRTNQYFLMEFSDFVFALKDMDQRYKNDSSKNIVNQLIDYDEDFISLGNTQDKEIPEYTTGGVKVQWLEWLNDDKNNSMNPLLKLFKINEKITKVGSTYGMINNIYKKENVPYEPLCAEFNYFEIDENNYFTTYYPVSTEKISDNIFIVNIETDKPVDIYGAVIVAQNIRSRIEKRNMQYTGENFNVVIRVNDNVFHGMNSGLLMTDIVNDMYIIDTDYGDNGGYLIESSQNIRLNNYMFWTPSEEVRPWVDEYFSIAAEAYKNDSYFSIFETIEQVADKYGADYLDVENVIMSCYFVYHGRVNV